MANAITIRAVPGKFVLAPAARNEFAVHPEVHGKSRGDYGWEGWVAGAYSASLNQPPIVPTRPLRKNSTHSMKIAPWVTVTQAPNCAR